MENQREGFEEVIDVENYGGKDEQFSHKQLVMTALKKTIDAGGREMRSGWFNEKMDKNGNIIRTYVDDTRKQFIESIETLKNHMACDMDETALSEIKEIKKKLSKDYLKFCAMEKVDWDTCNVQIRKERYRNGNYYRFGYLSRDLPYYQEYVEAEIMAYREILEELIRLTKRLDFYETGASEV